MNKYEIAKLILKLLDCRAEDLVDEIYKISNIVKHDLNPETFTGRFDMNDAALNIGDSVLAIEEDRIGIIAKDEEGLFVDFPDGSCIAFEEDSYELIDDDMHYHYLGETMNAIK